MEKPLRIRLHALSPIHIGCDDVYEPTSFVIDAQGKELIEFDVLDFIKALQPAKREEFSRVCSNDNLLPIFRFVKQHYSPQIGGRRVDVASGLAEHYGRTMGSGSFMKNKDVVTQFSISKTACHVATGTPFIPGSSLKGALRTAYLSILAKERGIRDWTRSARDLEIELLGGSFQNDPFRMVKVSDLLPLGDVETKVLYAVNKKKRDSEFEARGPFQILQAICSGTFEGLINIEAPDRLAGIGIPITAERLLAALGDFYNRELKLEELALKGIGAATMEQSKIASEQFVLVRIGRHSGAEAVTINGNRQIKIMQGKGNPPKTLDRAITFWLASDSSKPGSNSSLLPFGWAALEITNLAMEEALYPDVRASHETAKTIPNGSIGSVRSPSPVVAGSEKKEPEKALWKEALLTYTPGNQTLTAKCAGKKAETMIGKDRSLVPEKLHRKLFDRRESVRADVTVQPRGNAFVIVHIGHE